MCTPEALQTNAYFFSDIEIVYSGFTATVVNVTLDECDNPLGENTTAADLFETTDGNPFGEYDATADDYGWGDDEFWYILVIVVAYYAIWGCCCLLIIGAIIVMVRRSANPGPNPYGNPVYAAPPPNGAFGAPYGGPYGGAPNGAPAAPAAPESVPYDPHGPAYTVDSGSAAPIYPQEKL